MALDNRLIFVDSNNPLRWVLWSYCILNRAVAFGAQQQIAEWVRWAGGASTVYIPPSGPLASGAVVIQDGIKGLICLGGTRNVQQLGAQIVGSAAILDPVGSGRCGSFWCEYANRISPLLDAAIGGLPGNAPVCVFGHSLGAAVAQILACRYQFTGNRRVAALVTTGSPRPGDATLNANNPTSFTRIYNVGDPVTGIPPNGNSTVQIGTGPILGQSFFSYQHGGTQWSLTPSSFARGTDQAVSDTLQSFMNATLQGSAAEAAILQFHDINIYAENLYNQLEPIGIRPGISDLISINGELNALQGPFQIAPAPVPIPPLPPVNVVADPNVIVAPPPARIPLPDFNQLIQFIVVNAPQILQENANPILLPQRQDMATLIKCTFFWAQRAQGWSESYYRAGSISDTVQKAYDLGNLLVKFRGTNTALINFRLALVNVPTTYPKPRLAQLFPALPSWSAGTAVINGDKDSDNSTTCMLMKCFDSTGNAAAKFVFWRGISDNFVVAGGIPIAGGMTVFGGDWTSIQSRLAADGWGWIGNTLTPTRQAITGLVQTATPSGYVAMTFAGNLFPNTIPLNSGIAVPIRISQLVVPGNLNGSIPVVIGGNLSQATTKKKIAILPWDGNSGVATFNPLQFWQFKPYVAPGGLGATGILLDSIGERKTGRPFGSRRGRLRNRVRA